MASPTPVLLNNPVGNFGAFTKQGQQQLKGVELLSLTGTADKIDPHTSNDYLITIDGVDAMTLAAPTAGVDDGKVISIQSNTDRAHTLTATGLINSGSASENVATFAAFRGAGLTLMADGGEWFVRSQVGITFS